MFSFEDNIGLLLLKWSSQKTTPVCEGMLQIWPLARELCDKMFNFEDNIGLLVLKIIILKNQVILKIFHPPDQKRKKNVQIEMWCKLILQNIIET